MLFRSLCAGSIGTTQVLHRSGIGPSEWLSPLGIDIVADMQGIGHNLQDHLQLRCAYKVSGIRTERMELDGDLSGGYYVQPTIFEGDNTILLQLVAKGMLTEYKDDFHELDTRGAFFFGARQVTTGVIERTIGGSLIQRLISGSPGRDGDDALTDRDPVQLILADVEGEPGPVQIDDGEQGRARAHVLAQFNHAAGHLAALRGGDVQFVDIGLGLPNRGARLIDLGRGHGALLGAGAGAGQVQLRLRGLDLAFGRGKVAGALLDYCLRADAALFQRLIAGRGFLRQLQVGLGRGQFGLAGADDFGPGGADGGLIALRHHQCGLGGAQVCGQLRVFQPHQQRPPARPCRPHRRPVRPRARARGR
mgnify:CR=1 FL=1